MGKKGKTHNLLLWVLFMENKERINAPLPITFVGKQGPHKSAEFLREKFPHTSGGPKDFSRIHPGPLTYWWFKSLLL